MKHIATLTLIAALALPAAAQRSPQAEFATPGATITGLQESIQERRGPAQELIQKGQERRQETPERKQETPKPAPTPAPAPQPNTGGLTLAAVRTQFASADLDRNDSVSLAEALRAGVSRSQFGIFDADSDGQVTRDEFVVGMRQRAARLKQAVADDLRNESDRIETLRRTRAAEEARRQAERAKKAREEAARKNQEGPAARRGAGDRRPAPSARGDGSRRPGVRPAPRPAPKPAPSSRGSSGNRRGGSARG
jgi:regulator of protease activity HflC (stomatin/prohibitin superfamily)